MPGVFVSYRRTNARGQAERLYRWLDRHFGGSVYKDTEGLSGGDDYGAVLRVAVAESDVLLAVIGRGWSEVTDEEGRRRLDEPGDLVAVEIATAFEHGVEVLAVLLPGAAMPLREELPAHIQALAGTSSLQIGGDSWAEDVEQLIRWLASVGVQRQLAEITSGNASHLRLVHELHGHTGGVQSLCFGPDGFVLATAGGRRRAATHALRLSDAGVQLRSDDTLRIWRVADGSPVWVIAAYQGEARAVAISRDGVTVATGDGDHVRLWRLRDGAPRVTLAGDATGLSVTFSADGALIASGSPDGAIAVWRTGGGEQLRLMRGHRDSVTSVVFAPAGDMLASGSEDGTVRLWHCAAGTLCATLRVGPKFARSRPAVRAVCFSPDGDTVAAGCTDGRIRCWRVADATSAGSMYGADGAINGVSFSPSGSLLASGSSEGLLRLSTPAGDDIRRFENFDSHVTDVAFSPDGRALAAAIGDTTACVWRVGTTPAMP